jgi:flagellar hook-length control protein FliK
MITFDLTQETPASSTGLIVEPKGEKSKDGVSFSALLKGIKESDELVQNGALLLSLEDSKEETAKAQKGSKGDLLLSFLQDSDELKDMKLLDINPELKESLSTQDLKQLIKDAKAFLKDQITATDGFKRAEVDKLPKTLKGLMQVAQKLGVDISKITLEEVQNKSEVASLIATTNLKEKAFLDKSDTKNISEEKVPKQPNISQNNKSKKQSINIKAEVKVAEPLKKEQKQSTSVLLFQVKKTTTNISTEQIVNSKMANTTNIELPTPKKRANDTLKLLLQAQKSIESEDVSFTKDFSVATAKVIVSAPKSEPKVSLESLLKSESSLDDDKTTTTNTKTEPMQLSKADSFEVKLNEAKQMIKYLSTDVKEAIDSYKAPFTRIKVQLHPQQLGDIELIVVQRGKNLHVNLSSNNAAINTLAMNANDLKIQLQNSGINNASLNFSNNSQSGEQAAQHQQQNREQAQNAYNYFDKQEREEELLSSLEIVVPNYA